MAGSISPTAAGLALVYALDLTRYLKQGTNMASKAEADFNSAERIVQVRLGRQSASQIVPGIEWCP